MKLHKTVQKTGIGAEKGIWTLVTRGVNTISSRARSTAPPSLHYFWYFTTLFLLCQSFGQIFYQEYGQNADDDPRANTENTDGGKLYKQRRRIHQPNADRRTRNVAQNRACDADCDKADFRKDKSIQEHHDRVRRQTAREIEREREQGTEQRAQKIFRQHKQKSIPCAEQDDDQKDDAVRQTDLHIGRHR